MSSPSAAGTGLPLGTDTRLDVEPLVLVTGATGKVGRAFITRFMRDPRYAGFRLRALCHNRTIEEQRVDIVRGSIADRDVVREAMDGVTHVVHLATVKETPDAVMDVSIKGLFWLLEEARTAPGFRRFLLLGGDAAVGHFHYRHPVPVTEEQGHTAFPGCYALSKVLEEVMVEQYAIQYDLGTACLRAPWIMEKDDLRWSLRFTDDQFGAPRWRELVGEELADRYERSGTVPVLCDSSGRPVRRNLVHVSDLVEAMLIALEHPAAHQETFNVGMDEPVDYRRLAEYLDETRGLPSVDVHSRFESNWLDNAKVRSMLGWSPGYDLARLVDDAWVYERSSDEPRQVRYPG